MNVDIPTPPTQWRNVRWRNVDVHVTQVNMNVSIATPPNPVT